MNQTANRIAPVTRQIAVTLPEGFLLRFAYDRNCPAMQIGGHRARFKKAKRESPLYFNVDLLAASAALRHYGSGYKDPLLAASKELMQWAGWLNVRKDGRLIVRRHMTGHNGRLREFSASIGEAIALYLLERLFGHPLSLYRRIPENGGEGMDFAVATSSGGLAVEAKARADWQLKSACTKIAEQMLRQTAAEKYGFVVLYQQKGKRRKSSCVHVVDPPGDAQQEQDRPRALEEHYYQVSWGIGLWPLAYILGERLGLPLPPSVDPEYVARVKADPGRLRLVGVTVRGRRYVGRFFDPNLLTEGDKQAASISGDVAGWPYFFYGLDQDIVARLLSGTKSDLEEVIEYTSRAQSFSARRQGEYGVLRYAALSDGVLRIDLSSRSQLEHENLDLP
jgi:hypothetical protein